MENLYKRIFIMENNMNNIITIAGSDSKRKKGQGVNAVLTLMKELGDFQDKVASCIEAQDISQSKEKLEIFYDKLDEMAEVLLGMASVGIKSKKKDDIGDELGDEEEVLEEVDDDPIDDDDVEIELDLDESPVSSQGRIQMVNVPTIPRFPR
jgi:hypothetical protein